MFISTNEKIVLITGANGGIGFELAVQLLSRQQPYTYHVLLGSRTVEKGSVALRDLRSRNLPGTVSLVQIDVTNDVSISSAAAKICRDYGYLDYLINNAGISGATNGTSRERMLACIETNAIGAALVTDALTPQLLAAPGTPRIINISSGSGSIERRLDASSPSYKMAGILQYRMSKAALNMVSADKWAMLGPDIKVFAFCPGFVVSNFSAMNMAEKGAKPAVEAVMPAIDIIEGKRDMDAGQFLSSTGRIPW